MARCLLGFFLFLIFFFFFEVYWKQLVLFSCSWPLLLLCSSHAYHSLYCYLLTKLHFRSIFAFAPLPFATFQRFASNLLEVRWKHGHCWVDRSVRAEANRGCCWSLCTGLTGSYGMGITSTCEGGYIWSNLAGQSKTPWIRDWKCL